MNTVFKKLKAGLREQFRLSGAKTESHCEEIMSANSTGVNIQPTHKCSFCGKNNVELSGVMIAGPGVSICQECVFLCVEIVFEKSAKAEAPTQL